MSTVNRNGIQLSFLDAGQGDAIILLPPFPFNGRSFRKQIERLTDAFRVIAPDYRGFGKSDLGTLPIDMALLADDTLFIIEQLGLNAVTLGGVSMGGYVAFEVLRRDASKVKALVLWDTHCVRDDAETLARREQTATDIESQGTRTLVESLLPRLLAPNKKPSLYLELENDILSAPQAAAASAMRGMAQRTDARELLSRFCGPSLVMVGREDRITPPEKARQIANLLRRCRFIEIDDAGHFPHLECPEKFNNEFLSFLSDT